MVSEVAAILQVVLEAVMLWYGVGMSHAAGSELTTKRRRRVVRSANGQSIKRVLRTDRWRREHGLLRIRKRQRIVRTTRRGKRGLRRRHVVVVGRSVADHVGWPKHLRTVEVGLRGDELAMATRWVLEVRTARLLEIDTQATRKEGRGVIEVVIH
jgi:hypothetical protein